MTMFIPLRLTPYTGGLSAGPSISLFKKPESIAASSATVYSTDKVKVNFPMWVG